MGHWLVEGLFGWQKAHVYGMDYQDTFLPVAKLTSMHILVSLATTHH